MSTAIHTHEGRDHEERAREFVDAVRAQLSDLPGEEIEELTDGLQADLADRLGDGGELDDPERYAEELRQAAGLPLRIAPDPAERPKLGLRERAAAAADGWRAWLDGSARRRAVRDFAVALKPVWWVMRGVALTAVLALVAGWPALSPLWMLAALLLTVLSVQWGRGRWAPAWWGIWARRIASVVAVLAILPLYSGLASALTPPAASGPWYLPGLNSNETQVTNIFAYGCEGEPLDGVQLFSQDGQPLHTGDSDPGSHPDWVPMTGSGDGPWADQIEYRRNAAATMPDEWNVFPLREIRISAGGSGIDPDAQVPGPGSTSGADEDPEAPYLKVPGLSGCEAAEPDAEETER